MSVIVKPYNPQWPSQFMKIKSDLEAILKDVQYLTIEHVGSTSVPGLAAKPIIDIDIIADREAIQNIIDALVKHGNFTYLGELGIVDRHALRDPDQSPARNIYVCVVGAFQTRNHIGLRDVLRRDAALRDEYSRTKLDLAAKGTNIVDYIEAKGEIIHRILKEARSLSQEELRDIEAANQKGEKIGATRTKRLLLREFVLADVDAFHRLESIPEVVRYQNWGPKTKAQVLEDIASILQGPNVKPRSHFELAVLLAPTETDKQSETVPFPNKDIDTFIGRVGAKIHRESKDGTVKDLPHADLWFSFMPEYQGHGYACEAMEKFIELLGAGLDLEIECDPRNIRSRKLAERLGFMKDSEIDRAFESKGEWVGSVVYRKDV